MAGFVMSRTAGSSSSASSSNAVRALRSSAPPLPKGRPAKLFILRARGLLIPFVTLNLDLWASFWLGTSTLSSALEAGLMATYLCPQVRMAGCIGI